MKKAFLLIALLTAMIALSAQSYEYKTNVRTGKPDMVTKVQSVDLSSYLTRTSLSTSDLNLIVNDLNSLSPFTLKVASANQPFFAVTPHGFAFQEYYTSPYQHSFHVSDVARSGESFLSLQFKNAEASVSYNPSFFISCSSYNSSTNKFTVSKDGLTNSYVGYATNGLTGITATVHVLFVCALCPLCKQCHTKYK